MRKISVLLIIFSLLIIDGVQAQQDVQYTQYMYNTMSVNPGYAGSRGVFSAMVLGRTQWVGLDGAPQSQTLTVHFPLEKFERVGLGVSVVNDKIGPTQETYLDIDFSYTINAFDGDLAFGLKGSGQLLDINISKLSPEQAIDPLLVNNVDNKFSPNVGLGLYYTNEDKFYLGVSVPRLLETRHYDSAKKSIAKERINIYLIAGYVFPLSESIKAKPAVLFKSVSGAPLQADMSANFLIKEKLTLGAAYRWSAAFSGMIGYQFTDGLMFGFAYDKEVTDLGQTKHDQGSFEAFLRFELNKPSKILSPRFF